jgi:hypothetical protein
MTRAELLILLDSLNELLKIAPETAQKVLEQNIAELRNEKKD